MNYIQRRLQGFRDIRNFFFIKKVINKNKETEDWIKHKLRTGYINQIYTVISLREEDMGEEDMVQRMKVIEAIEPINRYIESLNLAEIVYLEISKIPDSRSWLITYWPLSRYFSLRRLIFQIISLIIIIVMWNKFDINSLIHNIFN